MMDMANLELEEARHLIVECLREAFGGKLIAVLLFGSRARGDHRPDSDYDILVLLDGYLSSSVDDYFMAYKALRPFRDRFIKDTTVAVISVEDLKASLSAPLILNALVEGIVLYDIRESLSRIREKLLKKLKSLGIKRVRSSWGYTWRVPRSFKTPFEIEIDIEDPPSYAYRLRLAEEHLEEARRALNAGAIVAAVHEAQLSIENSAKAVIAVFIPPSWTHNPAPELRSLVAEGRIPSGLQDYVLELAEIAEEAAPHHALSSYGDVRQMATPHDIYDEEDAKALIDLAEKALIYARNVLRDLEKGATGPSP